MKKYTLLFFLLILMSGCSKTSAKILPNSTSTVIASTEAIYTASVVDPKSWTGGIVDTAV